MPSKRIGTLCVTVLLLIALVALPIGATATTLEPEDAHFAVEITDVNTPVAAGESLTVTANVTNTGEERDSQQIHLKNFDDQIVDSKAGPPLTLDPGEQQTVSLRWNTTAADVGNGDINVQSDNASSTTEARITLGDGHFVVDITDVDTPVAAGESLAVTADITNTGDKWDYQQIHLKNFDDQIVDSKAGPPLGLNPGEQQTVSLRWNTTAADVGNGDISVQSDDEYPSTEATITPAPTLTSDLGAVDSALVVGETLTVPINVTNTGNTSATPTVWMALNSSRTDTNTIDIAPGTTKSVTFNHTTVESDVGTLNLTAGIDSQHETTKITVSDPLSTKSSSEESPENSSDGSSPNVLDRQHATIEGPGVAIFAGGDVRQVRLEEAVDGKVVATRVRDFSDDVTDSTAPIERYQIKPPEAATESNATIQFQLPRQAVDADQNRPILVKRWTGTNWTDLPTDTTWQDDELIVEAKTTGFSSFAVTVAEPAASSTTAESVGETRAINDEGTETQSSETSLLIRGIVGGLVALLLLVGFVGAKRR